MTRLRNLRCACCGSDAGRWKQWPNRDTGFGLCAPCAVWLRQPRGSQPGLTAEELERNYGRPGEHYADPNAPGAEFQIQLVEVQA